MFRTSLTLITSLALLALAPAAATAQDEPSETIRTLVVSGTGQSSAEPDETVIRVGVDTRAPTARAATRRAARSMEAVVAALREAGVAENDIKTVRLELGRYRERNAQREVVDRGWRVSQRVRATIRDIEAASEAIDAAVRAGATAIDSIRFQASDPSGALEVARIAAIDSASAAATTLARASGLEVLGVVRIIEGDASVPTRRAWSDEAPVAEAYFASVPVEPGLIDISTNVTVEYEIG